MSLRPLTVAGVVLLLSLGSLPPAQAAPPTVIGRTPGRSSFGVGGPDVNVRAQFSEQVTGVPTTPTPVVPSSPMTLRAGTAETGPLVPAHLSYGSPNRVTLNPDASLAADTTYTVRLTSAIRNTQGEPLAPVSWSFTTGPSPTVVARTPGLGVIPRTRSVTATFSEQVTGIPTTPIRVVATTRMTLRVGTSPTGTLVPAGLSYNPATLVAVLNPDTTLAANTQYTARLTSGIRDAAGNPLGPIEWSFTTGP